MSLPESDREQFVSSLKQKILFDTPGWVGVIWTGALILWQEHGYFQVDVKPEAQIFSVDAEGEHVFVTIHVSEGPKRWLKQIRFREKDIAVPDSQMSISESRPLQEGRPSLDKREVAANVHPPPAFPSEQLRKLIPMQDGDVFNMTQLREGFNALQKLYVSEGYLDFSLTPLFELDDKDHSVSVTVELDEGKQFHVGKVEGLGIDAALVETLQVALPKGDIFRQASVDAALKSALPDAPTGRVALHKTGREGAVDITFDLRRCPEAEQSIQR